MTLLQCWKHCSLGTSRAAGSTALITIGCSRAGLGCLQSAEWSLAARLQHRIPAHAYAGTSAPHMSQASATQCVMMTHSPIVASPRRQRRAMEVLKRIAQLAVIEMQPMEARTSMELRFPLTEFRSLVLNPLGRNSYPDKGMWQRHKVELCGLLLQRASGNNSSTFPTAVQDLVQGAMCHEASSLARLLTNPRVPDDAKAAAQRRYDNRLRAQVERAIRWADTTIGTPAFAELQAVLTQVLGIEPSQPAEIRRDGAQTEAHVANLVSSQLPQGWRCVQSATIVSVAGVRFENQKTLKGEADVLLVDPDGVVQALVEVKTAGGNALLALYEDVAKLTRLVDMVSGQRVTVATGPQDDLQDLDCSPNLKPIYVLGTAISAVDMPELIRSAQLKILSMELGRRLGSSAEAWAGVRVATLSRDSATLHVSPDAMVELAASVERYFQALRACDIYMIQA